MSLRCGCYDEADDIVFGPMHRCTVDPKPPADLPRFIPSVPTPDPDLAAAFKAAMRTVREYARSDFTLSPPEPRYMETLGPDELED